MSRKLLLALLVTLAALSIGVGSAAAKGGRYVFNGGTSQQQAQVTAALEASAFPWGVVPQQITVNIAPGIASEAAPGQIWLDAKLLDIGTFSWSIVQHEFAHQVDFFLLDEAKRAVLLKALGGQDWCYGTSGLDHAAYGCERFASTLAWAYWPVDANSLRPDGPGAESAALPPKQFKALLGQLLIAPAVASPAGATPAPASGLVATAPSSARPVRTAALASTNAKRG